MSRGQNFEAAARDSSAFLSLIRCRLSMFGSCVSKLATENFDFRKKILSRWISNYVKTSSTLSFFRPGYICVVFSFQQSILKVTFCSCCHSWKGVNFQLFWQTFRTGNFFRTYEFHAFCTAFSRVSFKNVFFSSVVLQIQLVFTCYRVSYVQVKWVSEWKKRGSKNTTYLKHPVERCWRPSFFVTAEVGIMVSFSSLNCFSIVEYNSTYHVFWSR